MLCALAFVSGAEAHQAQKPSGPWARVAVCEEGGRNDPTYGYLGIYKSTWTDRVYGGKQFAPVAGQATWSQQVIVANRIEAHAGHAGFVPDQAGCGHGW